MKGKKSIDVKKMLTIVLCVVFIAITFVSFALLTTVRKVEVKFAVVDNTDASAVQAVVDKYVGTNIILIDKSEVKDSLSNFSYVEVLSVEKRFPNTLTVSVKERREIYSVEVGNDVCIVGENGHLLRTVAKSGFEPTREIIKLDIGGVSVTEKINGQVLKTDSDQLFNAVLSMAKSVNLANCIKEISIIKYQAEGELSDVEFVTYTGVKICVYKAEEMGVEKIQRAFEVYDSKVSDYEKASDTLYVSYNSETDKIEVAWSDRQIGD